MIARFQLLTSIARLLIMASLTLKLTACRGTMPESNVNSTQRSSGDSSVAIDTAGALKPQIIERLIIRPKILMPAGLRGLHLEVRSESEVWCERQCSQFSLLDEPGGSDSIRLSAVKKTLLGNTTPGVLDVQQDLETSRFSHKNLEIMNVGQKGEKVFLSADDFNDNHPNFYALPMMLTRVVVRGMPFNKARFDDRDVELVLAPSSSWPDLIRTNTGSQAFVMGSYFEERPNNFGEKGVFIAKKIIYPWP